LLVQEQEADEFAAALLMPEKEFTSFCECQLAKSNERKFDIDAIARYFNVSRQAATVRGSILNLW